MTSLFPFALLLPPPPPPPTVSPSLTNGTNSPIKAKKIRIKIVIKMRSLRPVFPESGTKYAPTFAG